MASESQEKIQKHFLALSGIASSLNTASDQLTQAVGLLDEALKKLNIGLTIWVKFRSTDNDDYPEYYDIDQIGYCKVNGTWGIALQHIWGDEARDRHNSDGPWLFKDAPREMRIHAVDRIPELVEALSKHASEIEKKIQEKTRQVAELTGAIKSGVIIVKGISLENVGAIRSTVAKQNKFLGDLVMHAHRWERDGNRLNIYFSAKSRHFGEMIQGSEPMLKLHSAVQQVLGTDVQVGVQVEQIVIPQRTVSTKVPR